MGAGTLMRRDVGEERGKVTLYKLSNISRAVGGKSHTSIYINGLCVLVSWRCLRRRRTAGVLGTGTFEDSDCDISNRSLVNLNLKM